MVTATRPEKLKAPLLIDVTLLGMDIEYNLLQLSNAFSPMDVTVYSTPSISMEAGINTCP
jgi:hypothetical protein